MPLPHRRVVAIDLDGRTFDAVGHIAHARLAMAGTSRRASLVDDHAPFLLHLAVTLRLLLVLARWRPLGLRRSARWRCRRLRRSGRRCRRLVGACRLLPLE